MYKRQVDNGVVYVTSTAGELLAYDAKGVTNCSGSPLRCRPLWRGVLPATYTAAAPTIGGGFVYVVSDGTSPGGLKAFRTGTGTGCPSVSGTPTCAPVWQADVASTFGSPTVVGGVLYASSWTSQSTLVLMAFDAAGVNGCGGSPVVCTALWTAAGGNVTAPAVANGFVYLTDRGGMVGAYDAHGQQRCSGTPKTCAPLWTTTAFAGTHDAFSAPVVGGYIAVHRDTTLEVFDAHGSLNCAGSPAVCQPLWSAQLNQGSVLALDAVAYGNVYALSDGQVAVFDLSATSGCSGSPKVCQPARLIRWGGGTGGLADLDMSSRGSSLTIANGVGFVGLGFNGGRLVGFDVRSTAGCSGSPFVCPILWSHTFSDGVHSTPAVVDGRVYVGTGDGVLRVFAPAG